MQNAQDTGMGSPPGESPGAAREIKDKVGGLVSEARERLVEGAKSRAVGAVEDKKTTAAQSLGTVAEALREAAHKLDDGEAGPLGSYAESAAAQVEKVARYIRERDLASFTRDAETFARRHPEVFLGGAFLAGIMAARFLKSSGQRTTAGDGGGGYDQGYQGGYGGGYSPAGQGGYGAGYATGGAGADRSTAYTSDGAEPFNPPHVTPTGGQ